MTRNLGQDQLRKHTAFLWPDIDQYADRIYFIDANPGFDNYASKPDADLIAEANAQFDLGKDILIFFNMSDPMQDFEVLRVHNLIPNLKFSPDKITYLTLTSNGEDCYKDLCASVDSEPRMNIVSLLSTMHEMQHYGEEYKPVFKIENKPKQFLCYNRVLRLHRIAIAAKLLDNKLIDKGYFSFYGKRDAGWVNEEFVRRLDRIDVRLRHILRRDQNIIARCTLDDDFETRPNPIDLLTTDFKYFEQSYYSIVTETVFFKEAIDPITQNSPFRVHSITLTEKLFKPVAMKHPLIVASSPYTLKTFRSLGFKSYAPYINESYDEETDDFKRLDMVIDEVKRLSQFTDEQWLDWQRGIQEIVEYNYNHLQQARNYKLGPDLKV